MEQYDKQVLGAIQKNTPEKSNMQQKWMSMFMDEGVC